MKLLETQYRPHWVIELTRIEIKQLMKCSESHYDSKCQSVSKIGGIVYGMAIALYRRRKIRTIVTWREVDLLCKVLEQSNLLGFGRELFDSFYRLLAEYKPLEVKR
jgi:hypothetical protein